MRALAPRVCLPIRRNRKAGIRIPARVPENTHFQTTRVNPTREENRALNLRDKKLDSGIAAAIANLGQSDQSVEMWRILCCANSCFKQPFLTFVLLYSRFFY